MEVQSIKELLQTNSSLYIEEILFSHFGALMNFVKECESLIEQGHNELLKRYTGESALLEAIQHRLTGYFLFSCYRLGGSSKDRAESWHIF